MHDKYSFVKYQSLENDFLIFQKDFFFSELLAQSICYRKTGVGGDGIILYQETQDPEIFIFLVQNADGSDGGFSGNGSRCLAAYLFQKKKLSQVLLKTKTKEIFCIKKESHVVTKSVLGFVKNKTEICIGKNSFDAFYVDVGNPHLLFYNNMSEAFFLQNIFIIKKQLSLDQNISLIYSTTDGPFIITYERGVGFTQGCSSAALAFLTLVKSKFFIERNQSFFKAKELTLFMRGGHLLAKYTDEFVELSAQAFLIFEGNITI